MDTKELFRSWNGRRYYSLDCYLKKTFDRKLYKLSIDGGMTCPNRDGKVGTGGCIFCSGGSGDFSADRRKPIDIQIEYAKALVASKAQGCGYIAYFQAYTNTYAPVDHLERLFMPVVKRPDIDVLSIATRPDCLEPEKTELLSRLAKIKPLWVELGLQTVHPSTAKLINRGYDLSCYDNAVRELKKIGANVIVHLILGLPFERVEQMKESARYVGESGADGVKLQLLHVLRGTRLEEMYNNGVFDVMTEQEYAAAVADVLTVLPPNVVIHRLTGDGNRSLLVAPLWSGHKRHVLNSIQHELKARSVFQGSALV